ncbi:MAG: DnaD domain protein [Christensenellaceae bacterium]|nr:DnaD domain protein [Christensenellaceae bacterium]
MSETIITREPQLFDSTAVDNLFISELMPSAPENAVKVYLYGLMQTMMPTERITSIENALGLSKDEITDAFRYWQKQGIVRILEGEALNVQYLNLRNAISCANGSQLDYGRYAEFVKVLQLVLGTRNLSGNEMQRIYDWIEVFGFDEDAAVEIVRHCIEIKGSRVHINYMDSVAKRLAADNQLTYDAVHDSFTTENELASDASAILKRWRTGRRPTEDELALYEKWTKEWGFSKESIDIACGHVIASDKPNFKYLDAILEKYHESGSVSPDSINALIKEQDMLVEIARRTFARAGLKRNVSSLDRAQFELWYKDWHMSTELILYAAELSADRTHPFAEIKKLLTDWHSTGIVDLSAAKEDYENRVKLRPASKGKSVNRALNYKQNKYTAEQLRELGIDTGESIYED